MPRAASARATSGTATASPGESYPWPNPPGGEGLFSHEGSRQSPLDVITALRIQLSTGAPWDRALLEAMGQWTLAEETHNDRRYKYMVGREAFDWLLLAERLCAEIEELIPPRDLERLLFQGELPEPIEEDQLRELLGVSKYRAYLNFHYGVVLEEALQLDAEENVRKRHLARGFSDSEELAEEAFRHLYTQSHSELLKEFRSEAKLGPRQGLTLSDLKEFTYWLHKRRVNYWDPARVASDTRIAICRLAALRETGLARVLIR